MYICVQNLMDVRVRVIREGIHVNEYLRVSVYIQSPGSSFPVHFVCERVQGRPECFFKNTSKAFVIYPVFVGLCVRFFLRVLMC